MKKKVLIVVGILFALVLAFLIYGILTTRSHSPLETVSVSTGKLDVSVNYCRPYKKGRLIFGEENNNALVPYGNYWRLGANDATEITFSTDVVFAGKSVKAGSYRMYAVPSAESWEVSLNSELGEFGYFEPDYEQDVVKVNVPVQEAPQETEQFTITLTSDSTAVAMDFIWDKTMVRIPITK
ncbi:MAG: DUF2911 domain-containing protein [Fulvivirga sp.]|uniref:DUF2911 domain-containing protein n=1 Tax=Fulvivirga sp. TaxID=1931237 RepID=UPI0032EED7FC